MATLLRNVPVQPLLPPEGVVMVNGDWRYAEFADGNFVPRVGPPLPASLTPLPAASEPSR